MAGYIGSKTSVAQVDGYTRTEADAGFVSDPNGAVTVDGSGNVGIGITPSYPLHVSGNAGVTGSTFVGSKFSAATPDYSFLADSSLGMFRLPNVLGFSVAGTERMRIDAAGRVTMPYQPAFVAYGGPASLQTAQTLVWTNTSLNREGAYNTSNGRFTAPTAGLYQLSASVRIESGAPSASYNRIVFYVNSTAINLSWSRLRGRVNGEYSHSANDQVIGLSAGDYVTVEFQANAGTFSSSSQNESFFSGYLIG